ncbi:MAG: polyribonucleotide nucleotidyltransferase [Thermoflexales bacterium]|nr:polyribonucleotide nucleotidyltransferase [Thermoflexales bacterium]MDW8053265.1 polyribonucleotide nucleotidyltransferase [Anaerolineae bacterium]
MSKQLLENMEQLQTFSPAESLIVPAEKPAKHVYEAFVGNHKIVIETGHLAKQAGGAVTARMGDTMVLATATMAKTPRQGIDFFPLNVEYEERLYAAGRIPGSFFRREGRPPEAAILIARLVDRPLRPLFPDDLRNDVQVIVTALSHDQINDIDVLAVNAASAALIISDVPFTTPVGAVRIGLINGELVINPTIPEMEYSDLDLRVAGTRDAIVMVECGANEVDEETMVRALKLAHESIQDFIALQERMRAEIGKPKADYPRFGRDEALNQRVRQAVGTRIQETFALELEKAERQAMLDAIEGEILAQVQSEDETVNPDEVHAVIKDVTSEVVRRRILTEGIRPDGRTPRQIRPIWIEVGDHLAPRAHGVGLFTRGETQVLSVVTLGSKSDAQPLDGLHPVEEKRYMHHYNFPPYSTGEVKMLRGSSRREIGHSALAERALLAVLPSEDEFPYTIRVVSEVLSSNGSTSMASVCGSTLALMDAGVPIKAPVAGIAMGLVTHPDGIEHGYAILSDIQGIEDHIGDMDFKVAGTRKGITALQMDIKISGLTPEILAEALAQAREGRLAILDRMMEVISEPRPTLKPHAPRILIMTIDPEKIGTLIGPGGKTVRSIQDQTGAEIDIQEDGRVFIVTPDAQAAERARELVASFTGTVELGGIYTGRVTRVTEFGAFVEIFPRVEGMVHVSQLAERPVRRVEDVVRPGQEITVMVIANDNGKLRLSRRAVLEGMTLEEAQAADRGLQRRTSSGSAPAFGPHAARASARPASVGKPQSRPLPTKKQR